MYKVLKRTCWAIVLPIRSFVFPRPRCSRRRGLLKVHSTSLWTPTFDFRWVGNTLATPTPSRVKISLYRSSMTSRYDLCPSRSGFCDPEQKKHNKMESTFFHKLSTNRNVRWTILFVASQESQGKVPGFPDSTRDWNRQRRPVSRL